MNERIVELIKQSGTDVSGKWMSMYQVEKFAQLIVEECMKVSNRSLSKYELPSDKIAEHFGVES